MKYCNQNSLDASTLIFEALPEYAAVKASLYRNKIKYCPKIPASLDDIRIEGSFSTTETGKRFLLAEFKEKDLRLIILNSKKIMVDFEMASINVSFSCGRDQGMLLSSITEPF